METPKSLDFPIIAFFVFLEDRGEEIFSHYFRNLDNKIKGELLGNFFYALHGLSEDLAQKREIFTCVIGNLTVINKVNINLKCLFLFICENFPNPESYKILIDDISQSFISEYREEIITYSGNSNIFYNFHEKVSQLPNKYLQQIFPLREIVIIDKLTGITMQHKSYRDLGITIELLSGFMTALTDFSVEVFDENINSIIYEELQFIFELSEDKKIFFLLICEKWADPLYFRTIIQNLMEKFTNQYHDILLNWSGNQFKFDSFQKEFDLLPQKFFDDFYKRGKERKIKIFFSYSEEDNQIYKINKLADLLEQIKAIDKVYYWERDATGSIIDYMNERVPEVDSCIFFYSERTNERSGVRMERDMAVYHNKHIIPVFKDINHVPPIIRFNSGVDISGKEPFEVVDKMYHLISLKFHLS